MRALRFFLIVTLLTGFSAFGPAKPNAANPSLPIVLIGPLSVGKSTVARELSKKLGKRNVSMDMISHYYYYKNGFDEHEIEGLSEDDLQKKMEPYTLYALQQILEDFPNDIIDFGAGHSHYKNAKNLAAAKKSLSDIKNVILLLPSKERKRSIQILKANMTKLHGEPPLDIAVQIALKFLDSSSNRQLASRIVYTEGRTPEKIADEIIKGLK